MIEESKIANSIYTIQNKIGIILTILTFLIATLNFISGIINFGNTPVQAFTHITVFPTIIISFILLITCFKNSAILKKIQTIIVFLNGFTSIILTETGDLTGVLILLFGISLAYQYGYFASLFYTKMLSILGIFMLITFTNALMRYKFSLISGIPSILFILATIYLFWIVFREEINIYLIRTNQLSRKLNEAESENIKLELITADQAVLIEEKNRILEENLKEKTEIEKELRRTLKVKDVLLQEVHHRVKNNLTVINSLFNLQKSTSTSEEINRFIEKNSNRLYAMAAVHEIIHQREIYGSVDIADYFTDITQNLIKIYSESNNLKIDIFAEDIEVTIDIAVSLGIILNDCIANTITYGFKNITANKKISINIKKMREIKITISDNGRKFPINIKNADKDEFFSIWLIKILVEDQLNGSIETGYDNGNIWIIRLPYEENQDL